MVIIFKIVIIVEMVKMIEMVIMVVMAMTGRTYLACFEVELQPSCN